MATAGREGSETVKKARQGPRPSVRAASSMPPARSMKALQGQEVNVGIRNADEHQHGPRAACGCRGNQ